MENAEENKLRDRYKKHLAAFESTHYRDVDMDSLSNFELNKRVNKLNQTELDLKQTFRLIIAEGDLNSKHMKDIEVSVTNNASARVEYKGLLLGFYRTFESILHIREGLEDLLPRKWFRDELKEIKKSKA